MNLKQLKAIGPKVDADLKAVFEKYGLRVTARRALVTESTGELKFTIKLVDTNHKGADGASTTPERERWKRYAPIYGLKVEWLDERFSAGGKTFKVSGIRDGKSPKCVIAEHGGKSYVFHPDDVVTFMGRRA